MYISFCVHVKIFLLAIDETIKFLGMSCWQIGVAATVSLSNPLSVYTGENFCYVYNYLACLAGVQYFSGGAPKALMRVLYVQFPDKVRFEQRTYALTIAVLNFALTAGLCYAWTEAPKRGMDLRTMCIGRSSDFHLALFDYSSDHSVAYELRMVVNSLLALAIIWVLLELCMYLSIYRFLVRHNREMKLVLSENIIKGRIRKNTIDFACQAAVSIIMLAWLFSLLCTAVVARYYRLNVSSDLRVLLRCYSMSMYGVLSASQIGLCSPLRRDFCNIFSNVTDLFSRTWIEMKAKTNEIGIH